MANSNSTSVDVQRNWGWLFGLGVLFLILGSIGLGMTVGLTMVSMIFFGVLLIIAGLSQIADVFNSKHWKGTVFHALIAVLYILGGFLVIDDPLLASKIITAMLAGVLIVIGITRLVMAFVLKDESGWRLLLIAGLAAIILGILIFTQWPYSGLWVIGLFIAIDMIISGWTYIFIALSIRRG